jgi:hypothetical protein
MAAVVTFAIINRSSQTWYQSIGLVKINTLRWIRVRVMVRIRVIMKISVRVLL